MFEDLRSFIEACRKADDVREIRGAHWDLEIGALIEATTELIRQPPLLIFDDIPGYPSGYRVASLLYGSYRRGALLFGFSPETTKLEVMRLTARKVKEARPVPPKEVSTGAIMENVREGSAVDVLSFPVPRFHALDGGRYIGTGDLIIMRSPGEGWLTLRAKTSGWRQVSSGNSSRPPASRMWWGFASTRIISLSWPSASAMLVMPNRPAMQF